MSEQMVELPLADVQQMRDRIAVLEAALGQPPAVPPARPAGPDADYDLVVTVRVYGGGTAGEAADALRYLCEDLPGDREVEIIKVRRCWWPSRGW